MVLKMTAQIIVDGETLELNAFVERIVFEVNAALLSTLRGASDWKNVVIQLGR